VCLKERPVMDAEVGRPLSGISSGLGVRIERAGTMIGFWEDAAKSLCAGDVIVEIVPTVG
jgi:voltage-gated potassium channel